MIRWWLGRPGEDATKHDADNIDAPETPAPVFAARAIKSAIFGSPEPEDEYEEEEDSPAQKPARGAEIRPAALQDTKTGSPAKPQGILLTPGTATTRRKTVTFGATVIDHGGRATGKSGIPNDCPGKFPSPWTPKVDEQSQLRQARQTALTKTLEAARERKPRKPTPSLAVVDRCVQMSHELEADAPAKHELGDAELKIRPAKRIRSSSLDLYEGDITLDLNEPHSQSGRYWKSEYERYHEDAKAEMKKLVKYKQLAKSYAQKKDNEAIDLGEKLKEEQQKVATMEEKVIELRIQIADMNTNGKEQSPHLIQEPSGQTALAVQYRDQVNEFQALLQERDERIDGNEECDDTRLVSPRTAKTLAETTKALKRARKQLGEMSFLRAEMHRLRLDLQAAEKKTSRLRDENSKMSTDFTRVKNELLDSEQRRNATDLQNQSQDESFLKLQKDYGKLKELAKSQRRDAEHLLKKRHDQVAGLRKEVALLKVLLAAPIEDDEKIPTSCKDSASKEGIRSLQPDLATAKVVSENPIDLISWETPERYGPRKGVPRHTQLESIQKSRPNSRDDDSLLDSKIPILNGSTIKPDNVAVTNVQPAKANTPTKTMIRRALQPAVGEISDVNAILERPSTGVAEAPPSPLASSFQERFSNLSLDSPGARLPSLELSVKSSVQKLKAKPPVLSPRPSMFNVECSPPKHTLLRPRSSGNDTNAKAVGILSSSRLSSMNSTRARISLPPERAAAAKARLEQKKRDNREAEKIKMQQIEDQKENIRN